MRIFEDVLTGDEVMTDAIPFTLEYEGTIMKVQTAYVNADSDDIEVYAAGEFDSANNAGGAGEPVEKVLNVVKSANLQQVTLDKKQFMAYIKEYLKKIVPIIEKTDAEKVAKFKEQITIFTKNMVKNFDELEFYCGKNSYDEDEDKIKGAIIISMWEDESASAPVFYYINDGLKAVKV